MSEPFRVKAFKNPSGARVWQVSGRIEGRRVRRNFKRRDEAEAERKVLEIRRLNSTAKVRNVETRLSESQVAEAELVFSKLGGLSLSAAVDFYLEHRPPEGSEVALEDAVASYLKARREEVAVGKLSEAHAIKAGRELVRFSHNHPDATLGEFTPKVISSFLEELGGSLKSHNNRRGHLSAFWKWCIESELASANPVSRVPHHRNLHKRRGRAETLSADTSAALMEYVEAFDGGRAVPFYALAMFAGIRPDWRHGEMAKLRPADIDLPNGCIHVEPEVSKTNEARRVSIAPNLAAWLEAYPPDVYPICTRGIRDIHHDVRARFNVPHDGLRHTFISMLVTRDRSVGSAALEAGNSEAVLRKHYLRLHTEAEAAAFWKIRPERSKGKVVRFQGPET